MPKRSLGVWGQGGFDSGEQIDASASEPDDVSRRDLQIAFPEVSPAVTLGHCGTLLNALMDIVPTHSLPPMRSLEKCLSRALRREPAASGGTPIPFAVFDERPAAEPILSVAWTAFISDTVRQTISPILSGLLGHPAEPRQGPSATHRARDGSRTVFPPASEAAGWLDRIDASERTSADPFALALFAYAQTVLSHPYRDGNGRLARAMYQRSLARSGLLHGPFLPLGPLVYANHRIHDGALQHLGTTGDWNPFIAVMLGLTRKAAAFTAHTLAAERTMP